MSYSVRNIPFAPFAPFARRSGPAPAAGPGLGLTLLAAAGLVACGGGSDQAQVVAEPLKIETVEVSVKVLDAALQNARVCFDVNANGLCDLDETVVTSNAEGIATLVLARSDVGRYGVVAMVGADAVDKDAGPVNTAYVMRSPADSAGLISPLTTLVQTYIDVTGVSSADALGAVQERLGFKAALLGDYVAAGDSRAAAVARLWVLLKQQQTAALVAGKVAGTTGVSASNPQLMSLGCSQSVGVSCVDIDALLNRQLLEMATDLGAASAVTAQFNDPGVRADALLESARELAKVAALSDAQMTAWLAAATATPASEQVASVPSSGLSLRWFDFTDKDNYVYRSYQSTAEQNTPDANGYRHFTDFRESRSTPKDPAQGSPQLLQFGVSYSGRGDRSWIRDDTYWTGTEWFACPAEFVHQATPWSAQGLSDSLYCRSSQSRNQRKERDISGLLIVDVVKEIRAFPLKDAAGQFADWGPDPARYTDALNVKFPANARLYYQTGTDLNAPYIYRHNAVRTYLPDLANGLAASCALWTAATDTANRVVASRLEDVIAANPGRPCSFNANAQTGPRNEAWSASSLGLGNYADASLLAPSAFYRDGVRNLRVSFAGTNKVSYWSCLLRVSDGSARNCDKVGEGGYEVKQLGDASVLSLSGLPVQSAKFANEFLLVERAGVVNFGFKSKPAVNHEIRLNKEASEALFTALQMTF